MARLATGAPSLAIDIPEDVARLVDVEDDAAALLADDDVLATQFTSAIGPLLSLFPGTARVQVSLLEDPEDEQAPPHLIAELGCPLDRRAFRERRKQFFRDLRNASCLRLYDRLTVLQL